ncbi:glycoside hydrolase family 9 protein [Lentzea sp. CA-135723]|uniref:glycoside hydrolase family 9 protein n=1 Tax=Lentzea sp. CA-135723 TaxID=3239950 RepID=UPI003D918292
MTKSKIAVALVALLTATACGSPRTGAEQAVIRVDQVGYAPHEAKHAYLMAKLPVDKAEFRVVDRAGRTVLSGVAGARERPWNSTFRTVRVLDLSALHAPGSYHVEVSGTASGRSPEFRVAAAKDLFDPLAADNVRFFRSQRDGADVDETLLHRKPSHLADRAAEVYAPPRIDMEAHRLLDQELTRTGGPVDVEGGWFDAGDFLKFTHTTSYSTAQLLLAQRDGTGGSALAAEARHGIDWLARMWTGDVLYAQVGIGVGNETVRTDHDVWRLPEDDDRLDAPPGSPDHHVKHRPVFPASRPGEPVSPNLAGRVAAAFALSAQVNAQADRARAVEHLGIAAQVYARADRGPAALVTAYPPEYYPESSWLDDLEFGATELALAARALGDSRADDWTAEARQWAERYLDSDSRGPAGLADVSAMAHADLAGLVDQQQRERLVDDLRRPLRAAASTAGDDPFRAGVSYVDFDSVPHAFGLVISGLLNRKLTGDRAFDDLVTWQRNWALGANPWGVSFVVGAGSASVRCPSHQVANLTAEVPVGAVVNGPNGAQHFEELNAFPALRACPADGTNPYAEFDGNGARFLDHAGAWASAEVAIDFTSTALLAFTLAAQVR